MAYQRRLWTAEEHALLSRHNNRVVAQLVGVSERTVANERVRLGLPPSERTHLAGKRDDAVRAALAASGGEPVSTSVVMARTGLPRNLARVVLLRVAIRVSGRWKCHLWRLPRRGHR